MHSRIGLLMVALWGFTYISGEVENNTTTPAKNKDTQVDAVSYWKSMQTPLRTDGNRTQQTEKGRSPPEKGEIEAYVENISGVNYDINILDLSQVLPGHGATEYNLGIIKVRENNSAGRY